MLMRIILKILILITIGSISLNGQPIKNEDCLECHSDKTLTKTNSDGRVISLFIDETILNKSVHKTNSCYSCHSDITKKHPDDEVAAKPVDCGKCHSSELASYRESVHWSALTKGESGAATCIDCHGKHDILPPTNPQSTLHFSKLAKTCGECHPDAARDVSSSIHGKAVEEGHREAATCTDCHSEHRIEKLKGAAPSKISENVCAKCHASERINTKFKIPANRVKTFMDSYHGLASHYGSTKAANCASCHGYHKILPSSNPQSMIHPKNLVQTCGRCHPGATEKFAMGKIHVDYGSKEDIGALINYWVQRIYIVIIITTIGLMFVHNFGIWLKKALETLRAPERIVERMSIAQRIQHFLLMVSFFILAVSGFALKFPDSWFGLAFLGDEEFRRILHRTAGVVLLGVGVYHIFYVLFTVEGRQFIHDILPVKKDFTDIYTYVKYLLGKGSKPAFERFGYIEKVEYWALIWGTVIMGVTGIVIWFKVGITHILPRWVVDVSITVHYYEAVLACLAIIVWHFYHVIFDPEVYPMNWAWFDGKISKKYYESKHSGESKTGVENRRI